MTLDRWQKLSLAEQIGNIGSEVGRVRHWKEIGDSKNEKKALERALELINLTIRDKRWKGRLRELTRLREVFCDWLTGQNIYQVPLGMIENYCLAIAMTVRKF